MVKTPKRASSQVGGCEGRASAKLTRAIQRTTAVTNPETYAAENRPNLPRHSCAPSVSAHPVRTIERQTTDTPRAARGPRVARPGIKIAQAATISAPLSKRTALRRITKVCQRHRAKESAQGSFRNTGPGESASLDSGSHEGDPPDVRG